MSAIQTIKRSASQKLSRRLMENIRNGVYKPGQRLESMRKLSSYYGVSVAVVRNSFKMLSDEGVIETRHGSGTYIKPEAKYHRTKVVALLTSYIKRGIEGYYESLLDSTGQHDALPLIVTIDNNWEDRFQQILLRKPDAIMIDVAMDVIPVERLAEMFNEIPHCYVNRWEHNKELPQRAVLVDYLAGLSEALMYQTGRGHQKIMYMGFNADCEAYLQDRIYQAAVIANLNPDRDVVYYSLEELQKNPDSLKSFYEKHQPTAVCAQSDWIVHNLRTRGIKVCPEAASLNATGFFNLHYSRFPGQKFTTFDPDFQTMWRKALQMLAQNDTGIINVKPEIIVRKK
jgi:DNA-binding LacI/PurR family transcriptional regulator